MDKPFLGIVTLAGVTSLQVLELYNLTDMMGLIKTGASELELFYQKLLIIFWSTARELRYCTFTY